MHLKVLIEKFIPNASWENITSDRAFDSYLSKDPSLELMHLRGQKDRLPADDRVYKVLETHHTVTQMKIEMSLGSTFPWFLVIAAA